MYSVEITPDGEEALIELAEGDMRRVLNVLHVSDCDLHSFCDRVLMYRRRLQR